MLDPRFKNAPLPKIETVVPYNIEEVKTKIKDIITGTKTAGMYFQNQNDLMGLYTIGIMRQTSSSYGMGSMSIGVSAVGENKTQLTVQTVNEANESRSIPIVTDAQNDFLNVLSQRLQGYDQATLVPSSASGGGGCLGVILITLGSCIYYWF